MNLTARQMHLEITYDPDNWEVPLMNFVDELRRTRQTSLIASSIEHTEHIKLDNLMCSVVCELCEELEVGVPSWVDDIEPDVEPWFISGVESLKAFALIQSPLNFRIRNIFVMENFLSRC